MVVQNADQIMSNYEEYDEIVICKKCNNHAKWGDMTWLNGECMCPECYQKKKEEENEQSSFNRTANS